MYIDTTLKVLQTTEWGGKKKAKPLATIATYVVDCFCW